jgi:GT2 family glycosyltransferase
LALLDADDLWTPDHLKICVEVGEKSGADLVISGSELFDSDTGESLGFREPQPGDIEGLPASLFETTFFQPSAVLLRRDSFAPLGYFNPEVRVCEDIELWLRACQAGLKFTSTKKRTCRYRKHKAAITSDGGSLIEAKARVYERFLDYHRVPKSLRFGLTASAFASAGQIYFRKDPLRASQNYDRAWRLQPWRVDWALIALLARMPFFKLSK